MLERSSYKASDAVPPGVKVNRAPGPVEVSPSSTSPAPGPIQRAAALFTPAEQDEIDALLEEIGE